MAGEVLMEGSGVTRFEETLESEPFDEVSPVGGRKPRTARPLRDMLPGRKGNNMLPSDMFVYIYNF